MANKYSRGITYFQDGRFKFQYRGPHGIEWCYKGEEEFEPMRGNEHGIEGFTEAYNRAANVFTSSYKPPIEQ